MDNRRRFERVFHDAAIQLRLTNGRTHKSRLLDLSLNGCLVDMAKSDITLNEMSAAELTITLENDFLISMTVEAVFINKQSHVGFQITNIDLDSITKLRRLVELNLGDTELMERNLSALIAI